MSICFYVLFMISRNCFSKVYDLISQVVFLVKYVINVEPFIAELLVSCYTHLIVITVYSFDYFEF